MSGTSTKDLQRQSKRKNYERKTKGQDNLKEDSWQEQRAMKIDGRRKHLIPWDGRDHSQGMRRRSIDS